MIHLLIKFTLLIGLGVCLLLALFHVFPFLLVALAVVGLVKLWQLFRKPKPPAS